MIVHIIYSRSPSPKQFFLLTLCYRSLSIKRSTNRKHSIPPTQTENRQLRINTQPKPLFYLQSKPYKECNPSCTPAIHTLAHRDVIIVLFCVCLCLISVIYIFPLFISLLCVCACASASQYVSACV